MRKCCEGDGLLTLLLNFPSFQPQPSDSSLSERSSKLCKSSLSGTYPLSKQDSKTASTRYTTGTGNLAVPGECFRDLGAGWSPRSVCAGSIGVWIYLDFH